jgi:pimeloyl-ACP methyl ester carboxylesterase
MPPLSRLPVWIASVEVPSTGARAAIPAAKLIVYQDTGHLVLWEQPERVASDLTAFVGGLA